MTSIRKFVNALLAVILCFSLGIMVYAVSTITFTCWYATDPADNQLTNVVSRIQNSDGTADKSISIYKQSIGNFNSSDFTTYLNSAKTQWKSIGLTLSTTATTSKGQISILGGSRQDVAETFPSLGNANGITSIGPSWTTIASGKYGGETKYLCGFDYSPQVGIVNVAGHTANEFKRTFTHELGHALGWVGHSSSSADIMSKYGSSQTTLSANDKKHLKQAYDY